MQPRFTTQASCVASRTTTSWAVRPEGKESSTVSIQSGRDRGARFWKKKDPATPSGYRLSAIGRPPTARRTPSATDR